MKNSTNLEPIVGEKCLVCVPFSYPYGFAILANIYMHNVLILWYKFIITKKCKGDNFLIVYADDFVAGFQYKWEAENYYKRLKERMEKFGLQLKKMRKDISHKSY